MIECCMTGLCTPNVSPAIKHISAITILCRMNKSNSCIRNYLMFLTLLEIFVLAYLPMQVLSTWSIYILFWGITIFMVVANFQRRCLGVFWWVQPYRHWGVVCGGYADHHHSESPATEGRSGQGLLTRTLDILVHRICCDALHLSLYITVESCFYKVRFDIDAFMRGPVFLLRHDAVARILANGSAAFIESCAAIGWNSCNSVRSL